ncbi:helix-turn-helix domain-containing protein [Minwuia sp.]|uniref:helix-turn-helix domain-containing protein n=1 Tax=Minwuia sp. TaxID=2493630 RepID=UPI003A952199
MTAEDRIGRRVREMRKTREMTLEALATRTGLTKGYLSKIENARKLPPVATLSSISGALGCDIAWFFQSDPSDGPLEGRVSIVRADERQPVVRGGSNFGYDYQAIAHRKSDKAMSPFIFTFPPTIESDVHFEHEGEEMIFILSGTVEFEIEDRTVLLSEGDCIYFESDLRHRGRSVGGEAQALVVIHHRD